MALGKFLSYLESQFSQSEESVNNKHLLLGVRGGIHSLGRVSALCAWPGPQSCTGSCHTCCCVHRHGPWAEGNLVGGLLVPLSRNLAKDLCPCQLQQVWVEGRKKRGASVCVCVRAHGVYSVVCIWCGVCEWCGVYGMYVWGVYVCGVMCGVWHMGMSWCVYVCTLVVCVLRAHVWCV